MNNELGQENECARPMGENQVLLVPTPGRWPKDSYLDDEEDEDEDEEDEKEGDDHE